VQLQKDIQTDEGNNLTELQSRLASRKESIGERGPHEYFLLPWDGDQNDIDEWLDHHGYQK
jgi:hypothetical protein